MRPTHRPADAPALIISVAYVANTTSEDTPMLGLLEGAPVALDVEAPARKLWRPDPRSSGDSLRTLLRRYPEM